MAFQRMLLSLSLLAAWCHTASGQAAVVPPNAIAGIALDAQNAPQPAMIILPPGYGLLSAAGAGGAGNSTAPAPTSNTALYIGIAAAAVVILVTLCAAAGAVLYFLQDGAASAFRGVGQVAKYRSLPPSFSPVAPGAPDSPRAPPAAMELPRSAVHPVPAFEFSSSAIV